MGYLYKKMGVRALFLKILDVLVPFFYNLIARLAGDIGDRTGLVKNNSHDSIYRLTLALIVIKFKSDKIMQTFQG